MLFVGAFSGAERCTAQRTVWKPVNYLNLHILCLLKLHEQEKRDKKLIFCVILLLFF